ncbi:hypothetical protein N6C00_002195 [Vibrio metschnikovii]|nr:hypothetical protein [Vibrio metschnikovii]
MKSNQWADLISVQRPIRRVEQPMWLVIIRFKALLASAILFSQDPSVLFTSVMID